MPHNPSFVYYGHCHLAENKTDIAKKYSKKILVIHINEDNSKSCQ